jgi:hypothetical protein
MSPTQRTLKALKARGLKAGIVEKFNYHVGPHGIRIDLFGIIDIIALDFKKGFIGVQSCGTDFSGHMNKMMVDKAQDCIDWLSTPGGHLELWGWRKVKVKRGGKAMRYEPRVHVFKLSDFRKQDPVFD